MSTVLPSDEYYDILDQIKEIDNWIEELEYEVADWEEYLEIIPLTEEEKEQALLEIKAIGKEIVSLEKEKQRLERKLDKFTK